MKILLVEDDPGIALLIGRALEHAGYAVDTASEGRLGLEMAQSHHYGLLILDVMLPEMDGWQICEELRQSKCRMPILMVTARDMLEDRVKGLDLGADDYLPKPFEPRELLARIRSVLRRSHAMPPNSQTENVQQMKFSGWTLDLTARHLVNPQGVIIMLSGAEFRLLRVFLEHPNRVLNRDQLLNLTQGRDADPFDRSIDIQISRLRQKLGEDARMPQIIKTVRNGGYVLAGQVSAEPSA
jgi:two-component system OmpR family response regulator